MDETLEVSDRELDRLIYALSSDESGQLSIQDIITYFEKIAKTNGHDI